MKKRGAASFYIVAFSTLILTVIAISFAMVIMSEITRSMNDDLSQSAYDSALAGVEDAKVAYSNYRRCKEAGKTAAIDEPLSGSPVTCENIMYWMEHPNCQMVANILGIPTNNGEVELGGTATGGPGGVTTTNQAYTCVKIKTKLSDYRATLNSNNAVRTVRAGISDSVAKAVNKVKISWYSRRSNTNLNFANVSNFPSVKTLATPPTLEFKIIQTAKEFRLKDFDETTSDATDRATLYLVPTRAADGKNSIDKAAVIKSNDRTQKNEPHKIKCSDGGDSSSSEFYCSVEIELPGVISSKAPADESPADENPTDEDPFPGIPIPWEDIIFGEREPRLEVEGPSDEPVRNADTFMFSVSLPYQQPETDFAIELFCDDSSCSSSSESAGAGGDGAVTMSDVQVSIDSTGRANDLYRRVETRLETSDATYMSSFPYYALQILGGTATNKNKETTSECNFYDETVGEFVGSNCE